MIELTLFTTAGCHLCEQAQALLNQVNQQTIEVHPVDIALDDDLLEQYGQSIPVIRFPDNCELNWPFSLQDIETYINQRSP